MKYFTITFFKAMNYGAFLQCFALQHQVCGSKVLSIKEDSFPYVDKRKKQQHPVLWLLLIPIACLKVVLRKWVFPLLRDWDRIKRIHRSQFVKCDEVLDENSTVIVGSDQIWNPDFISNQERFFFADFSNDSVRRIAYAASLGKKKWSEKFENIALPRLKKFKAISVREESTVAYLKELGLDDVVCVCDPTILYKSDFYRKHFPYKYISNEFTFVYRIRENISEEVKSVFCNSVNEVFLQDKKTIVSVTKWLQYIDCSKFVVTDSFHCVVFCLLFHKPFLVILNRSHRIDMNERFFSLLGKVNLLDRCLDGNETSEEVSKKLNAFVDWDYVDYSLEDMRQFSLNWLKNALEN